MAINDNSSNQQQQQQAQQAQQQQAQQAPQQQYQQQPPSSSHGNVFTDFSGLFDLNISPSQSSELLIKSAEKFEEQLAIMIKGKESQLDIQLMILDRAILRHLSHSIMVVTYTAKGSPSVPVAFHAILLEATGKEQEVEYRLINNENVEIKRLPSDAINKRLRTAILREVEARIGNGRRVLDAEYSMLIKDFDFESPAAVHRLLANAVMACRNVLSISNPNWHDFKISNLGTANQLTANVSYNRTPNAHPLDDGSAPYRNDVKIELRTPDANQSNNYTESTTLTTVEGFVDLNYAPATQGNPMMGMSQGPQYLPRFIMTNFDSPTARSLGTQALALATSILLYSNNDALGVLAPNTTLPSDEVDLHDIGYLNYEAKVVTLQDGTNGYVPLKGADVTPQTVSSYMYALFRPTFELGLDVSVCGADTWVRSPYAAAATGNTAAINLIIGSLDTLTNNAFSKIWQPGQPIARVDSRVLLGRYQDSKGRWRDIRDIDYLAVMRRFGDKNINAVWEWANARGNPGITPEQSAFIQRRTTELIVGNAIYTGYALRLIFNPKFLEAVSQATQQAGLGIRLNAPSMAQMSQRYVYQGAADFTSQQIVGGLGQSYQGQGPGMHGWSGFGRF